MVQLLTFAEMVVAQMSRVSVRWTRRVSVESADPTGCTAANSVRWCSSCSVADAKRRQVVRAFLLVAQEASWRYV
jgi:hypothetical protein